MSESKDESKSDKETADTESKKEGEEVKPPEESFGEEVKPPEESVGEEVKPPEESVGEEVKPPEESVGEEVKPPEESGEEVKLPEESVGEEVKPPEESVGEEVKPPEESVGEEVKLPEVSVGEEVKPPEESVGEEVKPPEESVGEDEEVEEEEEIEEEPPIPLAEQYKSVPYISENCTLPEDILTFYHSFGYSCEKMNNLALVDESTLIFASGNFINIFDVNLKKVTRFFRTAHGGGVGHITVNPIPEYPHIAIAECGQDRDGREPPILIYEWPSLEILYALQGGALREYTFLDYSPDGELLCSQGGDPDYLLTVWQWKESKIMLRVKSHGQEVFKCKFSKHLPENIATCGAGHIKFWKMSHTFTGLKLQGELGRFGKTEISDILGFHALPDGKVLSGCEWGNILLWEDGLIRIEIGREIGTCHIGPISDFNDYSINIMSVGADGFVRVWNIALINRTEPPDDNYPIPFEPLVEFAVGEEECSVVTLVKRYPLDDVPCWFAQDAYGGILEVSVDKRAVPTHTLLFECHAGEIVDIAVSPGSTFVASIGKRGKMFIYDYIKKQTILKKIFPSDCCAIMWLPLMVDKTGSTIIVALTDGSLRMMKVMLNRRKYSEEQERIELAAVTKPHSKPVTRICINPEGSILITGSEDKTVFVYQLLYEGRQINLFPIGFLPVPNAVKWFDWKPDTESTVLICCDQGDFMEAELPVEPKPYTTISYELTDIPTKQMKFKSVKSRIRREEQKKRIEERKKAKVEMKLEKLTKMREENPDLDIDEEDFLAESEPEEEPIPVYVPEIPNPVLYGYYIGSGETVLLSMGGYDAGYIYEYNFENPEPLQCTLIPDADDIEVHSYILTPNDKYLIQGMQNGQIRINEYDPKKPHDLSKYWVHSMHDNLSGIVNRICLSYDHKHLLSCGRDANLFVFNFQPPQAIPPPARAILIPTEMPTEEVEDIDQSFPSLEEAMQQAELNKMMELARMHKDRVLDQLKTLRENFLEILQRNSELPESQQIPREELDPDRRVTDVLEQKLQDELDLVKRKLAHECEKTQLHLDKVRGYFLDVLQMPNIVMHGIEKDITVRSYRHRKHDKDFDVAVELAQIKLEEAKEKGRPTYVDEIRVQVVKRSDDGTLEEQFMKSLEHVLQMKLSSKAQRAINKYIERQLKLLRRRRRWEDFYFERPDPNKIDPGDMDTFKDAEATIGDYKLKTDPNYKVPKDKRVSTEMKYSELLDTKIKIFNKKEEFNAEIYRLRELKKRIIKEITELHLRLKRVHKELAEEDILNPPDIPVLHPLETPEKELEITDEQLDRIKEQILEVRPPREEVDAVPKEDPGPFDEEYEVLIANVSDSDPTLTKWEKEIRSMRMIRKKYEQDQIIKSMEDLIKLYDSELEKLFNKKFQCDVDVIFMQLFLITLNEELAIIKEFEAHETLLTNRVNDKTVEKQIMINKMRTTQGKMDERKMQITKVQQQDKDIQQTFQNAITENKFAEFLKKIFKKKYKPPKVKTDDDESSESSSDESSSSMSDESGSDVEITVIKYDENTCPPGCDRELFDKVFSWRKQRYELDQQVIEEKRQIEILRKELELFGKKLKLLEAALQTCQEELEAYLRLKQQRLNDLDIVVVLKLDQLQHFQSHGVLGKLSDSILFPQEGLHQLRRRIKELRIETAAERLHHRKNRLHLVRMRTDCKHMTRMISNLILETQDLMLKKFGRIIVMEDLEQSVLQHYTNEMREQVLQAQRECDKNLRRWEGRIQEKMDILNKVTIANTERINALTVLENERRRLYEQLTFQKSHEGGTVWKNEPKYKAELHKLKKVVKHQERQLQILKWEIERLKSKSAPPPLSPTVQPREVPTKHVSEAHEEEDDEWDWEEFVAKTLKEDDKREEETGTEELPEDLATQIKEVAEAEQAAYEEPDIGAEEGIEEEVQVSVIEPEEEITEQEVEQDEGKEGESEVTGEEKDEADERIVTEGEDVEASTAEDVSGVEVEQVQQEVLTVSEDSGEQQEEMQDSGEQKKETEDSGEQKKETEDSGEQKKETEDSGEQKKETEESGEQKKETEDSGEQKKETEDSGEQKKETEESGEQKKETEDSGEQKKETEDSGEQKKETEDSGEQIEETSAEHGTTTDQGKQEEPTDETKE